MKQSQTVEGQQGTVVGAPCGSLPSTPLVTSDLRACPTTTRAANHEPASASIPEPARSMKAPSFAALMGAFRAEHQSEVQAAAALLVGATTLSDYCNGRSLPTASGIKRLAPALGLPADELAMLVEAQRAAMQRGESIPIIAPVPSRNRRHPLRCSGMLKSNQREGHEPTP